MNQNKIDNYAMLIVDYCCSIRPGDRVLIRSTQLAASLILACQRLVLLAGATCELDLSIPGFSKQMIECSSEHQLQIPPLLSQTIVDSMDVIISIAAPHDLHELHGCDQSKLSLRQRALSPIKQKQLDRGRSGNLRWVICNYPTESLANAAGMTLDEYSNFIQEACFLSEENPVEAWRLLSLNQQRIVDRLNTGRHIQFKSKTIDISFDISNRSWINSDGRRNMPSGEVFTSPVETSANGSVLFDCPTILNGEKLSNVRLTAENGLIVDWSSTDGNKVLDAVFDIDGARCFGEIAIGTNSNIKIPTLNTLFDEKIGGTIHMAIGASYPETGGTNVSGIHHDFVAWFNTDSIIFLDGDVIYKDGAFIFS